MHRDTNNLSLSVYATLKMKRLYKLSLCLEKFQSTEMSAG